MPFQAFGLCDTRAYPAREATRQPFPFRIDRRMAVYSLIDFLPYHVLYLGQALSGTLPFQLPRHVMSRMQD